MGEAKRRDSKANPRPAGWLRGEKVRRVLRPIVLGEWEVVPQVGRTHRVYRRLGSGQLVRETNPGIIVQVLAKAFKEHGSRR